MSQPAGPCPALPRSALLVAVFALAGELALLVQNGVSFGNPGLPLSMAISAAVVAYLTAGVLEGGPIRLTLVLLGLTVAIGVYAWDVLAGRPGVLWPMLHLGLVIAVTVSLLRLVNSPYHRWQRAHHDTSHAHVAPVLVLAAVVGALGPVSSSGPGQAPTPSAVVRSGSS